jgi:hypothetical protein
MPDNQARKTMGLVEVPAAAPGHIRLCRVAFIAIAGSLRQAVYRPQPRSLGKRPHYLRSGLMGVTLLIPRQSPPGCDPVGSVGVNNQRHNPTRHNMREVSPLIEDRCLCPTYLGGALLGLQSLCSQSSSTCSTEARLEGRPARGGPLFLDAHQSAHSCPFRHRHLKPPPAAPSLLTERTTSVTIST